MNRHADISWESLHKLFSVVMCIDESMSIIYASETLRKFVTATEHAVQIDQVFRVLRPSSFNNYAEACAAINSLCLMTAKDDQFAIRGQLVRTRYGDTDVLCFCGAPWLFWLNGNCPDIHLNLNDFATQDVQLDQLFFMSTEKRMVADLENLAADLQTTKSQLEAAQEAQGQFFARMSHELRTPLNGVVSAISLLHALPLDEKQAELAAFAKSSSENLMEVINYILDISKLETEYQVHEVTFECQRFLQSTLDIVKAKANEKFLALELDIAKDLSQSYRGDTASLRQVLLNLLINGIKFTDKGSVCLRVRQADRHDNSCTLRFDIIDTGAGIAERERLRIFDPFFSTPSKVQALSERGTGLGLDIVRHNVEKMGGKIDLISSPGEGSTFWFEIPLTCEDHATGDTLHPDPAEQARQKQTLSGQILLVDDNHTNLLLGTMILESLGLDVLQASNGNEAVAAARHYHPDLVLMDLSMPDISGLEATRQIRQFNDCEHLPILALTAHVDSREKQACLAVGMNGYLTKPIDREVLVKELTRWLGNEGTDRAALVDEAVLQNLVQQIGQDNLRVVIDKVEVEARQRWQELIEAHSKSDDTAAQRHVHSLGSIFRTVGLISAGDAMAEIETTMRSGEAPAAGWIPALEPLTSESLQALADYAATL